MKTLEEKGLEDVFFHEYFTVVGMKDCEVQVGVLRIKMLGVGSFHGYNSLCTPYFPYLDIFLSDAPQGLTETGEIVSQYTFKQYNKVHTISKNCLKTSTWKYEI